jgi:hypothetical protein
VNKVVHPGKLPDTKGLTVHDSSECRASISLHLFRTTSRVRVLQAALPEAHSDLPSTRIEGSGRGASPTCAEPEGLLLGPAVAAEPEATIALRKDLLELSVGGKVGGQWDPHEGNVDVGSEVAASLRLKWDVVRVKK